MIRLARGRFPISERTVHAANPAMSKAMGDVTRRWFWLAVGLSLAASGCLGVKAQAQQMPGQPMPGQTTPTPMQGAGRTMQPPAMPIPGPPGPNRLFQERRIKALNAERQKELVSDTNKLLKLIAELNGQIGKKGADSLTPDQLHMLAKIEKLAKSVKDKMSTPVQQSVFGDSFPSPIAPMGFP